MNILNKNKKTVLASLALVLGASLVALGATSAVFTDTARIAGNVATTGFWEEEGVQEGDVVINEVMWMGSTAHQQNHDQWIELKNNTDEDIDISAWSIENAGTPNITGDAVIPANGYFLIANFPQTSNNSALNVSVDSNPNVSFNFDYSNNGSIVLRDADGNVIDSTPEPTSSEWPAGLFGETERHSMQRNSEGMWYTCDRENMTEEQEEVMEGYWKENYGRNHCGTPGHPNL